jgi:hypothetical protein
MVAKEVSAQQIAPVVAAGGGPHDGVHVERLGLVVVEEDALMQSYSIGTTGLWTR